MRLLTVLLTASVFIAGSLWGATARVVRAHPWLVRGLDEESLIGLNFTGSYGGELKTVTFRFTLTDCTPEDIQGQWLYCMRAPATVFFRSEAKLLNPYMTVGRSVAEDRRSFTLTFTHKGPSVKDWKAAEWIFPNKDYLWLTVKLNPAISREASIRVDVVNTELSLGGNTYTVDANGQAKRAHRIYPYKYRIGAYLRGLSVLNDHPRERMEAMTEYTLFHQPIQYDREHDRFYIDARGGVFDWTTADGRTIQELRGQYHPRLRLFMGIGNRKVTLANGQTVSALAVCCGDAYRDGFVRSVTEALEANGLNGLDIDWEYPENEKEKSDFGLLLRVLSEVFFDHGFELSVCISRSGYGAAPGRVTAAADFVNSMAYSPWQSYLGNQAMTDGIRTLEKLQVPKRRMVLGQSIYSNARQQPGWNSVCGMLRRRYGDDIRRCQDADTVPGDWEYNGKKGSYYPFCGPTTYRAKCCRARQEGLGGIMSWGYYSDVAWDDPLSLAFHQGQAVFPRDYFYPTPQRTSDGVYLLRSEDDWHWFTENPANRVRLQNDIRLTHDPLPMVSWWKRTEIDGAGHTLYLPESVWMDTFGDTAFFSSAAGLTVRDLTIDVAGRIVCRGDRISDGRADNVNRAGLAAVLVAQSGGGVTLKNVRIRLREQAEIRGIDAAAVLTARVQCSNNNQVVIEQNEIRCDGTVHTSSVATDGTPYPLGVSSAGVLIGCLNATDPDSKCIAGNTVVFGPRARLSADNGLPGGGSAGVLVGHVSSGNRAGIGTNRVDLQSGDLRTYRASGSVPSALCQPLAASSSAAFSDAAPFKSGAKPELRLAGAPDSVLCRWQDPEQLWGGGCVRLLLPPHFASGAGSSLPESERTALQSLIADALESGGFPTDSAVGLRLYLNGSALPEGDDAAVRLSELQRLFDRLPVVCGGARTAGADGTVPVTVWLDFRVRRLDIGRDALQLTVALSDGVVFADGTQVRPERLTADGRGEPVAEAEETAAAPESRTFRIPLSAKDGAELFRVRAFR